jgi:tetratricopeptide (TPR) repeat protein
MKKILATLAVSLLATSTFAADAQTDRIANKAVIKVEKKAQNTKLIQEAIRALKYTQDALIYLNGNKIEQAQESLKKAVGELAVVLNSPNPPYLLPVDVTFEAFKFEGTPKDVVKAVSNAKEILSDNKIPQARIILNSLRDEIVIKTINLPLATYPAAINLSLKYLNELKTKEAKDVLIMALSTLIEVDNVIPIPLIKAQALLTEAQKIFRIDRKQTFKYLEEAKYQLTLAEALGYTSKSETTYKNLKDAITNLEKEVRRRKASDSLFEEIIQKLKEFKEKAISVIHK